MFAKCNFGHAFKAGEVVKCQIGVVMGGSDNVPKTSRSLSSLRLLTVRPRATMVTVDLSFQVNFSLLIYHTLERRRRLERFCC